MAPRRIPLAKQIDRVPSTPVPLDASQELRFRNLMEDLVMVDIHQHPMVAPEDIGDLNAYLRGGDYSWGYQAVKHGGWTTVATANMFRGLINTPELSFVDFQDVLTEIAMMLADVAQQPQVVQVANADQIQAAKQQGVIGFLPMLEHLAIGNRLERLDAFYGVGVRLAGITYTRKNFVGDGQYERNDGGLSEFGIEVGRRMNQLGMEPVPQTPLPSRGQSLKLVTTEDGGGRDGLAFDALGPRARIPDAAFPTGMAAGGRPGLVHLGRG